LRTARNPRNRIETLNSQQLRRLFPKIPRHASANHTGAEIFLPGGEVSIGRQSIVGYFASAARSRAREAGEGC